MQEGIENDVMTEDEEKGAGLMSYEELMESRKISFSDIKEHLTGPVISTVIHVVLLAFLGTIIVFKAPEKAKEITVEMRKIEPKEIEPPPPPPEPPEPVEVENPTETPIERPNMEVDVDVQVENISVNNTSEIQLPSVLNMKMSNSALSLPVNPGGGGGGRGRKGSGKFLGFGYSSKADGDLVGVMYDLKTKPDASVRSSYTTDSYWGDVRGYIDAGLKYNPSMGFRQMKKKLYLSHLYIPKLSASEGPKQFGVEKEMDPSGFFIHYSGTIFNNTAFRFAGQGDDLLIVNIDGKIVLDSSWADGSWRASPMATVWQAPTKEAYQSYTGRPMHFGNWIARGKHKIDILFGERPGGLISAFLLVQEKNKTYPKMPDGRPILPIFTTLQLNKDEVDRIKSEPWTIATDGPVMSTAQKPEVKVQKEKPVTGLEIK